ncbi:MAG: tellurite resistance TerB family protein [Candidatus Anammoxibacter sp.]
MLNIVKKFFGKKDDRNSGIADEDKSQKIMVATCALLLEMANIDGQFSDSELDNILSTIKNDYRLSDENAAELIKAAKEELEDSTDLWRFTNLVNQNYSAQEKNKIIEILWQVVYADGILDQHEDYLIHKLAELLHIPHKELINAKLKVIHKPAQD